MDNKNLWKNDNGQAVVLVALIFSVLLGFGALAVDYAYLSLQKRELQNAADAAALAGIVDFSKGKVSETEDDKIIEYARKNSKALRDIAALPIIIDRNDEKKQLKVTITLDYDMLFSKVIGIKSQTVSASATAGWYEEVVEPVFEGNVLTQKIIPIAISLEDDQKVATMIDKNKKESDNLGFIGHYQPIVFEKPWPLTDTIISNHGYYGYYSEEPIQRLHVLNTFSLKEIRKFFENQNYNTLGRPYYLSSLPLSNKDEAREYKEATEDGLDERFDKLKDFKKANKLEKDNFMTAIVPVVKPRLNDRNYILTRYSFIFPRMLNDIPYTGEYVELDIVGFRTVIIRDFVDKIDGNKIEGEFVDKDWKTKDFDDFVGKRLKNSDNNTYKKSIIVSFGERVDGLEGFSKTNIVYRLVK